MSDFFKSVNNEGDFFKKQDLLIYGKDYHLWRDGKYLGIATYTDDVNVGYALLKKTTNSEGEKCYVVYRADEWQFV